MWKRLQDNMGSQPAGIQIGNPILFDTTLDQNEYSEDHLLDAGQQHVSTVERSRRGEQRQHERPPRKSIPAPVLPSEAIQQQQQARNAKQTKRRPASSLYSQPSPTIPDARFMPSRPAPRIYNPDELEISPPSSPDLSSLNIQKARQYQDTTVSPDVSPIEEMPPVSVWSTAQLAQNVPSSSIPTARGEARRNQVATTAANLLSRKSDRGSDTKQRSNPQWNSHVPETTTAPGRPYQAQTAGFVAPGRYPTEFGFTTTVTAEKPQKSFGDRVRRMNERKKGSSVLPSEKPGWKGASGRNTVVPPVAENFTIAPLSIPRKSSKRTTPPPPPSSGSRFQPPVSAILPPRMIGARIASSPLPTQGQSTITSMMPDIYIESDQEVSAVPAILRKNQIGTGTQPYPYLDKPSSSDNHTFTPAPESRAGTSPLPTSQPLAAIPPSTSQIERNFREALKDIKLPPANAPPEVSRFSITTYATSAVSTPRPSMDQTPPMSSPPQMNRSPVITRRRPRVNSIDSAKATIRKPMNNASIRTSYAESMATQASRRISMAKELPKSPPEEESQELIPSLQARVDNLTRRRLNLEKSIFQMTELMPQTGVTGRERERQAEERRKVEVLRLDLSQVKQEEHDVGLKLHRAWKREAEGSVFEPTSLWVKRVTE